MTPRYVEFQVPRCVASSKNRRRTFFNKRAGRIVSLPSEQAVLDIKLVQQLAREAMAGMEDGFPEDALLSLDLFHFVEDDTLTVRVTQVGRRPAKGKSGTRRDCHGMIETIADALQGVVYVDDRNIDSGTWQRVRMTMEPIF